MNKIQVVRGTSSPLGDVVFWAHINGGEPGWGRSSNEAVVNCIGYNKDILNLEIEYVKVEDNG